MSLYTKIILSMVLTYHLYVHPVVATKHNVIRGQKFICGSYAPELVNVTFDTYFAQCNENNTDNLFIDVTVYSRQQNLEWRPHMIVHLIVDLCKYLDGSPGNKFLDIIVKDLKKSSNFMHPCPYVGHTYLSNMTLNDDHFPPIVPPADIYIDFQYFMYVNGSVKKLYYLRPYLEVKTKGIIYFK